MKMSENAQEEQVTGFNLLLKRNVQHIWEQIFLSLDYQSLRNCLKVSRAWNEVFHLESFRAKMVTKFSTQRWMDTENLERKMWKSDKTILAWTANNEEIAFVEGEYVVADVDGDNWGSEDSDSDDFDVEEEYRLTIHFINQNGELGSRKIEGKSSKCNIWILQNIVLVLADYKTYAFTKQGLEQSSINVINETYYTDGERIHALTTHFNPAIGVRFMFYTSDNNFRPSGLDERGCIHLHQVKIDYSEKKDSDGACIPFFHDDEEIELRFGNDGYHIMCQGGTGLQPGMTCYTIESGKPLFGGVKDFMDDYSKVRAWRANSKYVVYLEDQFLCVRRTNDEDEDDETHYYFWPDSLELNDHRIDIHDIILTEDHVFAFSSYSHEGTKKDVVLAVDIEANVAKHAIGDETSFVKPRFSNPPPVTTLKIWDPNTQSLTNKKARISWGDHGMKINDGKIGIFPNIDRRGQLFLVDLTSGDPERVLNGRRVITSRVANTRLDCSYVRVDDNFIEVKQGMCLFEVKSGNFTLELIAWKGVRQPKALEKWCEWLDCKD